MPAMFAEATWPKYATASPNPPSIRSISPEFSNRAESLKTLYPAVYNQKFQTGGIGDASVFKLISYCVESGLFKAG
jgi:hypothetical protein